MKAALYARVSSRDQKSIPDQLADLRQYAKLREWTVVAEYEEKESGKRDTRPIRYELLKRAWKGEFDVVLVWKLDRFGRNMRDLVNTVYDLNEHRVMFVSFSDSIDLTTTNGRMMVHILAALAQWERETIVERVRSGVRHYREREGRWGRRPTARAQTDKVLALAAEGKNKATIARETGISRASVIRILKDAANA